MTSVVWKALGLLLALTLAPLPALAQALPTSPIKLRFAAVPDLPTFVKLGRLGVQLSTWFGLGTPKGTPATVVERLNSAIAAALQKPEIAKRFQDPSSQPKTSPPAAFAPFWTSELDRYHDLVKLSGTRID